MEKTSEQKYIGAMLPAGADDPEQALRAAARTMLTHTMTLQAEEETAEMLRAMGVTAPTGADGLMLSQYLKALRGDTASAKFVRDAAAAHPEALQTADLPVMEEPVLEDATLQAALETPVGRGAEDRIVYGEQLTLPGTDMPAEKETLPAGFEETAAPATEEDNPFARDAAPAEPGKVTLEALTSHGLEELKEEFPDADLDLDDIFKQGE